MRKFFLAGTLLVASLMLALPSLHAQQQTSSVQSPQQQGDWYCPWMSLKGQGQMSGCCAWGARGAGMHQRGRGMMASYAPQPGKQITQEQAKRLLEDYLQATGNPNLKLGNISNNDGFYEAEVVTKDGSLVDKIQVNKDTGWFRSAY
ncbi:MAG: hypothetical protein WCA08_11180 [Desulfoferrobacter sp.]